MVPLRDFRKHPLGFYYLATEREQGTKDRIHVWLDPKEVREANQFHTHSFDLHSTVRLGTLENKICAFKFHSEGAVREFLVSYHHGSSTLVPTERLGTLVEEIYFTCAKDGRYFLKAGLIHRAVPLEYPLVTMVQTVERNQPVFSYGASNEPPFDRRLVSADEADILKQTLEIAGIKTV